MTVRDACAIVGIGETDFSRNSGRTDLHMAVQAAKKAIEDAGLKPSDIDGLVRADMDTFTQQGIITALGIKDLTWWSVLGQGGAAPCGEVAHATAAILAGHAKNVLCIRSINGYSGQRLGKAEKKQAERAGGNSSLDEFFVPYGMFTPAQFYGITARQHMMEYGTKKEHLGAIAMTFRENANKNPRAQMYTKPMTMDDYLNVRTISEPLNLFDCCLETDGAAAVVVTSSDRAKDLKQKPAYIGAAAMGSGPQTQGGVWFPAMMRPDVTDLQAARSVANQLYTKAGVGPSDIDVAQLYDCFTITVLLQIEAYGFAPKGEGGRFVEGGHRIRVGGDIPLNTSGTHMSEAYIHGMNHITEGVRQIRGTSTNQVPDANVCLVTSAPHPPSSGIILHG